MRILQQFFPSAGEYSRGFSILELLVCVMILAILAAASVPDLSAKQDRAALAQAVASIEQLASEASLHAQLLASPVVIELLTAPKNRALLRVENGRSLQLPQRVALESARFSLAVAASPNDAASDELKSTVTYHPNGSASPGTIVLRAGRSACRLVQPLRGILRSECTIR